MEAVQEILRAICECAQPDSSRHEAKLKSRVKDRLARYKYPRTIASPPALRKTATGKFNVFKLG